MCGRYAFFSPADAVKRIFRVDNVPELKPRFNIAPTQVVPVVRAGRPWTRLRLAWCCSQSPEIA